MIYLLYTIHVITCLFLIMVVLLQQGKGADLSVFGGGATGPQATRSRSSSAPRTLSGVHDPAPTRSSVPTTLRTWLCRNERARR